MDKFTDKLQKIAKIGKYYTDKEKYLYENFVPERQFVEKYSQMNIIDREKTRKNYEEKVQREIENNQNLKDILEENRNLVSINSKLLNKMNSLGDTLEFLNIAFEDKTKIDKKTSEQQNALLLELITIIEEKDQNKLQQFMDKAGFPTVVGLATEYLKSKWGLG